MEKESTTQIAALFDLDGVVLDTETQYTVFWDEQGRKYLGETNFGRRIKGQTLAQIFDGHFSGVKNGINLTEVQSQIIEDLNRFETQMAYDYIPGAQTFIADLRCQGVKLAIVTSSNEVKMGNVYRIHPELKDDFDRILTADMFTRSKPAPDCFLLGMEVFGTSASHTFVFEDSFHGLQAGMSSGATVIGLATTNSREAIEGKAHCIIDDFTEMTYDKLLLLANTDY